ncbi:Ubiquinone biosynthesis O-methyltransferase, mitochondrial [subsurface metagenome]
MKNQNLKEFYEEFYEEYHKKGGIQTKVVSSNNFARHIILSLIDKYLRPDMRVLDIGCGDGAFSLYIANKGNEVLGIDISEKAIDDAQKGAELLGIRNASFKATDFLYAEFQGKFDFVILNHVLEHLTNDRVFLQKIHELLVPGGILYFGVPSDKAPLHQLKLKLYKKDAYDYSLGHLRRYTESSLSSILEMEGFEVMEIRGRGGILREILYCTQIGRKLQFFAGIRVLKNIITFLDNLSTKLISAYEIYGAANMRYRDKQ